MQLIQFQVMTSNSKYKIGDLVKIGHNLAQIVKVIEDIDIKNTLYLLQDFNKNEFIYQFETKMSGLY